MFFPTVSVDPVFWLTAVALLIERPVAVAPVLAGVLEFTAVDPPAPKLLDVTMEP